MRNYPVHWCEGLFLVPQHFQAADRHWGELLQASEHLDHEYNYGLRRLEYSEEAVEDFQFQIDKCWARTKEGTVLMLGLGEEPDRVSVRGALQEPDTTGEPLRASLQEGLEGRSSVVVYLALPKFRWGAQNVATEANAELSRYREVRESLQDESFGGNDQEVHLRVLQPRLLLSTQDLSNYDLLPLAQIRRAGDGGPQLDEKYVPPLLTIDAWPPLANKIVRRLYDQIGNKIDQYAEYVDTQEISWPSPDPSEGQWLVMLSYLSEAYAALHALVFARGVHPFTAYRELCRIVGRLSVFEPSRRPPEDLPRYDHENLGPIFGWFRDTIERLLDAPQPRYQKRYFFGAKHGMQVAIDSDWFAPGWEWYVGVWHGHLSAEQCIALLQPNRFFWKLGSIELVDTLFVDRVPGLRFDAVTLPPPALPKRKEWTYFKVSREPRAAWEAVQAHATLGMRYQDELIQNRDRLEGQRTLLVNAGALGLVKLEFALFAIPPSR